MFDPPKQRKILLGTVYRPPDGNAQTAINYIDNILVSLEDVMIKANVLVMGDFNIDYTKNTSPEYKHLKEFERNQQLKQYIKTALRITNRV